MPSPAEGETPEPELQSLSSSSPYGVFSCHLLLVRLQHKVALPSQMQGPMCILEHLPQALPVREVLLFLPRTCGRACTALCLEGALRRTEQPRPLLGANAFPPPEMLECSLSSPGGNEATRVRPAVSHSGSSRCSLCLFLMDEPVLHFRGRFFFCYIFKGIFVTSVISDLPSSVPGMVISSPQSLNPPPHCAFSFSPDRAQQPPVSTASFSFISLLFIVVLMNILVW